MRHPNKRVWLVHQFRQAYELDRTELGEFGESAVERATRRKIHELDRRTLGEATSAVRDLAQRRRPPERSLGLEAEVVLPPPQELDYRCDAYEDFVLSVGRLDRAKRVDLLLEAAAAEADAARRRRRRRPRPRAPRARGARHGLNGRVEFRGRVDGRELADLYARAAPSTTRPSTRTSAWSYEAFLSRKPVVTTTDAGGPLDVVADRATGLVAEPRAPRSLDALRYLRQHPDEGRAWGVAGKAAPSVTWDAAIERLLA